MTAPMVSDEVHHLDDVFIRWKIIMLNDQMDDAAADSNP